MTNALLLAQDFSVSVPETTTAQWVVSIFVLAVLIATIAIIRSRAAMFGLPEENRDHRNTAREERHEQTPRVWQAKRESIKNLDRHEIRDRIQAVVHGDESPTRQATLRDASREVYDAVSLAWQDRVSGIPAIVIASLRWAVLVAVFGAVAVSTGALVSLIKTDGQTASLSVYLRIVVQGMGDALQTGIDVLGMFPYGGFVYQLAWTFSFMFAEWLFHNWWLLAGLALVNAGLFAYLHFRRDTSEPTQLIRSHLLAGASVLGWLGIVWFVGTSLAVAGRAVGKPTAGGIIGFLAALGVGFYLVYRGVQAVGPAFRRRLERLSGTTSRAAVGVTVLYWFTRAVNVAAAVFVAGYAFAAVAEGKFARVGSAIANTTLGVQLAILFAVATVVVVTAHLLRESWPDVSAALRAAFARKAVRAQLVTKGTPLLVIVVGYGLLYTVTKSIFISIVASVVLAIVVANGVRLAMAASYKEDWKTVLKDVLWPQESLYEFVGSYTLHDADGNERYYLSVNGETYVNDDPEALVEDGVEAVVADVEGEDTPRTVSWWWADFLLDYGVSDRDDVHQKLRERVRKDALNPLRSRGPQLEREQFDRRLERYPDSIRRKRLAELEAAGVLYLDDQYVTLENDPFASRAD